MKGSTNSQVPVANMVTTDTPQTVSGRKDLTAGLYSGNLSIYPYSNPNLGERGFVIQADTDSPANFFQMYFVMSGSTVNIVLRKIVNGQDTFTTLHSI